MQFVIMTGMSGAGKTIALKTMEDLGYYCVDNMPALLIPKFLEILNDAGTYRKAAVVVDIRNADQLSELRKILDGLQSGRDAVAMIVGRDVNVLDEDGVVRAAVETVAENTSDGEIAPLLYMALFGPVGGCVYKAINTMDSMLGYRNERYERFGTVAARLDDVANFVPARFAALIMMVASAAVGLNASDAFRIWKRDRYKHASPNSAQTESVMAGALEVRLAGDAVYGGVVHKKEYIGDDIRPIETEDIHRSQRLMTVTSVLAFAAAVIVRMAIFIIR